MKFFNLIQKYNEKNSWTNVYGLSRALLAIGTILTLIFNDNNTLFFTLINSGSTQEFAQGYLQYGLFFLLRHHLFIARIISIILLGIVISGWRPRFVCIAHWYISFSFFTGCSIADGGDQLASLLTFLLIPICLTDPRKSHWGLPIQNINYYSKLITNTTFIIIRIQMSLIYLNAAVDKFGVEEWKNGTIIWYWFQDPVYGANSSLAPLIRSLLSYPFILVFLTWATLAIEFSLFMGLIAKKEYRKYLFIIGFLFHAMIIVVHGLVSFFFAMLAGLVIYLIPLDRNLKFLSFKRSRISCYSHFSKNRINSIDV